MGKKEQKEEKKEKKAKKENKGKKGRSGKHRKSKRLVNRRHEKVFERPKKICKCRTRTCPCSKYPPKKYTKPKPRYGRQQCRHRPSQRRRTTN